MATTINLAKESAEADTPLLFFECVLPAQADPEYWCTHAISFNGQSYAARVLKHNLFDLQLSADDAMDGITKLSLTLADADARLAELNAEFGFKGAQLTVHFAFADLPTGAITTESTVLFRGIAGDPDEISEDSLVLTFTNKLSLQRVPIPEVRIQRSCPWSFPSTAEQRTQGVNGEPSNRFSPFYRCGYSADITNGVGNLMSDGQVYTSCNKSRADCEARGMFNVDTANRATARFGGFEFVPSAVSVRTSGDKTSHLSPLLDNSAKYNDPVPLVYGKGWLKAPVIFSRNDGNLTHMEVLLGMGVIGTDTFDGVLKLVVNDVEIPKAASGQDMTTTGWYKVFTEGARTGSFNVDFAANNQPLGDPYGSMAAVSVVVPNRISSGTSLPTVQVLLQGVQIDTYNSDGGLYKTWSDNPAWVILDVLRRCGWSREDLNLSSFVQAADYCNTLITATDLSGTGSSVARYKCNLILTKRQSAAVVVRGIRVASSLMLRYGATGLLELLPETSIQKQQPQIPDGANTSELLNNGYPAYEFSDGSVAGSSGIVRNSNGSSTVRFTSRSVAETSNRLSVEFQDESNEYQQDSLSVVDGDDANLLGYEISSQSTALGIANFSQATRVLLQQLDKAVSGNLFVEFQTSFRALKIRPGDIISLSTWRPILAGGSQGSTRIPFRVVRLSPSVNYELVTILAQIHDDDWYSDNPAVLGGAGRQPSSQVLTPRPLIGLTPHKNPVTGALEYFDFAVSEAIQAQNGAGADVLTVKFSQPSKPSATSLSLPLLSLSSDISQEGGSLPTRTNFYYALSATDAQGNEGPLSFTVLAEIATETDTNTVTIKDLKFPASATHFNVYRGTTPQMLYRIESGKPIYANGRTMHCYKDIGLDPAPVGPPDANFDHANFYWRYEYSSAYPVGAATANTVGAGPQNSWAAPDVYKEKVVRILDGTGRGQERSIVGNTQTTLTVSPAWSVIPDASSTFVVTEGSWRFAAVSATNPVQFEIPYRAGDAIQISGRGANVHNQEGAADLCPLTRWTLGQRSVDDGDVAGMPSFQLSTPGGGEVTLYRIGFEGETGTTPLNTGSVSSGTLQLFHWDELMTPSSYSLSADLDAVTRTFSPGSVVDPPPSTNIQIGSEIMTITSVDSASHTYTVQRAVLGSELEVHRQGDAVLHLGTSYIVVPFSPNFFGNSASLNYIHTFSLPDKRIAAAQFFVTNAYGDSPTAEQCYSINNPDGGLRTLSGGQYSLQVSGYLATQQNAAPPLVIADKKHAIRDLRAVVSEAAAGYDISVDLLQNGVLYCNLTIGSGNNMSGTRGADGTFSQQITNGVNLPPLDENATLTMNITLQVTGPATTSLSPGRDLTVTIRL